MKSTAETIFFCMAYGFFSGAFLALTPVCVAFLTSDMRYFGSRMGLVFAVTGVASLTGNPIAGKLVADFGYTAARIWAGVCTLVGAVIVAAVAAGAQ